MLRPKQLRQKLRAGAAYLAIVAILAGGTPRATLAGVYTWLGATNTWETSGNWTPAGGPPGASDTALFDSSSGPGSTILLDGNQSLGNLIFGSGANAFTFDAPGTPNVLTLGDTGTIWDQNGSTVGLETLNDLIVLGPTFGTFQSDSSQGLLFTGAIKGSAATSATTVLNLRGLSGGLGTISGNIGDGSGGGYLGLNMSGAGMWTLTGDNTYSGGTTISGGTLNINNASALGSGSVLIDYNATLGTTTSFTAGQSIVLGTASSIGGGTIDVAQGTLLTLTSPISGTGGLIKTDGGTLVLDATNTYQGLTQVKGGNLVLSGSLAATGSTTATIGLTNFVSFDGTSNTSQLVLADGYSGFTLNANLVQNGGTGGSNAINAILSTGNNTLNGNLYLYAPGLDTFITSAAGMLTITGNLVGTDSAVFPRGPGNETYSGSLDNLANSEFFTENVNTTIILSGNNATYAGVIIPTYGTVRVSSGQNIGTGGVTFDQGQLEVRTDPSTLADSSTNFSTRNVTVGSNASGTGTLFIDRAVGGTGLNQTVAFNDLNLDAGHTLTITGLDGYGISFTGSFSGAIGVGDNGATDYGNAEIVNSSSGLVTINASLAVGSATGSTTPTNRTFEMFASGDMLATGSVIQTTSSTGTILPAIFEKAGTGTLTLSGTASTYTGGTEIYAGTLAINQMGALNGAAGGGVNLGTTTAAGALSYLGASGTGVGETTSAAFNLSGTTGAGMILGNQQSISTNTDPTALVLSSGVAATGAGAKNLILGGFNNTGNASVANTIAGVIQDNSTTYTTSLIKNGSGTWLYAPTASTYVTTAPTGATVTTTTPEYQNYLAVSSTTGLVVGESVSGTNVPAGSIITSISGSDIYINNPIAVAAGVTSGTGLTFGTVGLPGAAGENFTGNVTVAGGTLEIQPTASSGNGSAPLNAIAGATTNDITFAVDATTGGGYAGGTFDLLGTPVGITGPLTTQVGATLTLSAGAGTIETTPISGGGTPTLEFMNTSLTPITRSAGAVVNFIPGAGAIEFNTQPTTTNGILGGYAYFSNSDNTVDFATVSSGLVAAYTGYLTFPASGSTSTSTYVSNSDVTTTGTESVYALKIAGAQTITLGGNLTIGSGGVLFDDSTGAATIAGTGSLGTSSTETIITVAGNTPANALTVSAPIDSSSGALTKAGNGTLIISGANTYTGNTTIDEGTIQLSGPSATLGKITTAANVTTLRQNTTLDLDGAGPLTGGMGTVVIGALAGAGTVTNSGGGSDTAVVLDIGYGTTTTASGVFSGILQNGDSGAAVLNVTKNGSGTEVLAGLNTYTGVTTIADGTLQASNLAIGGSASSIGASSNAAANLVFNGGTLLYQGSNTLVQIATASPSVSTDRLFTLAGNGTIDSSGSYGNDVLGSASANNAALVFSNTGAVVFSGSGTRTLGLQGTSISDNEIALQLVDNPAGGALSVTKAGVGLWYLSNDNTYSGATTISAGALRAQDGVGLSPNSNLVIAGGVLESSGVFTRPLGTAAGDVQFTATGGFAASSSQLQVAIGGTADPTTLTWGASNFLANGAALILGSTSALSEVQILNPLNLGSAGQTINVVSNASTDTSYGTILGAISGGPTDTDGNATGLIKTSASAAGDLILAGSNSYTGNTVVSGGVLTIYSLGGTSAVTTATTSSLGASGSAVTADSIGVLQLTSGTLDYVGAGETSDRPIQLTSTSTSAFVLESNGSGPIILTNLTNPSPSNAKNLDLFGYDTDFNTISSNLTDTAADPLTITVNRSSGDDATWVLSGNNTFHGGVALADGTLGLGSNTAAGVGQISVNNAPALFATAPGIAIANNVGLNTSALLYVVGSNSFSVGTLYLGSTATAATSGTLNNEMTGGSFTVAAVSAQTGTTAQTLTFNGLGNTIVNGPITNGSAAGLAISYSGSGAGSLTLGGSTASTFTGAFTLAATGTATLILTNTSTPLGTGNFIWDAGTIGVNAVESLSNAVQLASGSTIGVSGSNSITFTGGETFTTSHALTNNLTSGNTLTFATGTLALGSASSLTLAGTGSTVISSSITGTATTSLAMNGTGGLTLSGTDTLSGTTAANAGTLTLNFDTNNTNKLSTTAALILGGGTLALNRLSSATSFTQTIGSITLTSGSASHITINNGGGAGTTNLASTGTITANLGAVFDFTPPSTGTGKLTVAAASSIYGWATIDTAGGNYFAANSAGTIVQATTTPVDLITSWTSTQNVTDSAGYNGTLSVNTTINSLRFNESSGASNVTMNSDVGLTITGGGILVTPSVGSAVDTITGGTLTAGTGVAELIVNQQNTSAPLTIASAIVNGSITNMPLVKASPGTLILTGANSYTGATYVNEGTLQLYGSGTLGILSNVVIGSTSTALLDLNGTSQTIGTLASSGVQTGLGTVDIDSGSLAITESSSTTYTGAFTGTGSLAVTGTGTLTLNTTSSPFAGAVTVGGTTVAGGLLELVGNGITNLPNVTSFALTDGGALQLDNTGSSTQVQRISPTATITLTNTPPSTAAAATPSGLSTVTDQVNSQNAIVGALTLGGGTNTLRAVTNTALATPQLTMASLTRTHYATLTILANDLGSSNGGGSTPPDSPVNAERGDIIVTDPTSLLAGLVGGSSNTLDTTTISILPWAMGQDETSAQYQVYGSSFVTYSTTLGNGFLALNPVTDYEQLVPTGGVTLLNNARYATSTSTGLTFTGTGHMVNSLLVDTTGSASGITVSGSGAGDSLVVNSGAMLFVGPQSITLTGFNSGIALGSGQTEYVFDVNNTTTTIASDLTTAGAVVTKSGTGTLILNDALPNGPIYVNEGTLGLAATSAVTGNVTVESGASLSLLSAGDGTGSNQTITTMAAETFTFLAGAPTFTVGPVGTVPLNKTIEANFGNTISLAANTALTVNNNSGFGLLLGGTLSLPGTAPATISVATATNSNVIEGLVIAGAVTGGQTGAGNVVLNKTGAGTLEFTGTGNMFGGSGSIIEVTQGVLAATSDAALGDPRNVIQLSPTTTASTFEALGTFATGRTIAFGAATATRSIGVSSGNTLTLNSPFDASLAPTAGLSKIDAGSLVFGSTVDNSAWTGTLTIGQGAVEITGDNNLNAAATVSSTSSGAALQVDNVTLASPLRLDGTGVDLGGELEAVGSNTTSTVSGLITFAGSTYFGADPATTLNLTGGFSTSTTYSAVFLGGGTINISGPALPAFAGIDIYNYQNTTPTTVTLGVDGTAFTGAAVVVNSALQIGNGTTGAGQIGKSATYVEVFNGTLTVNDLGSAVANRLGGSEVLLYGSSELNYVVNGAGPSSETAGELVLGYGPDTIAITNSNNENFTLTFSSLADLGSNYGDSLDFEGTFGTSTQEIVFAAAPALTGGLLAHAVVGVPGGAGNGIGFATYGANGVAAFTSYTPTADLNSVATVSNTSTVQVTGNTTINLTARTLNALDFNAGGSTTLDGVANGGTALTLTAGDILVTNNTTATIGSGVVLVQAGATNDMIVNTGSSLVVNGTFSGSGYFNKDLGGSLTFNAPQYFSTAGYFNIGDGTITLDGGNNTIYEGVGGVVASQAFVVDPGATLDLDGTAQMANLLLGESSLAGNGGTITSSVPGGTFVINNRTGEYFSGQLTGDLFFAFGAPVSTYEQILTNTNTYTGGTLITGAYVELEDLGQLSGTSSVGINYAELLLTDNGNSTLPNRVNTSATVTLEGATLAYNGRAQTVSTESLGPVVIAQGLSTIAVAAGTAGVNSADLQIASFSQAGSGAMVNFTGTNLGLIGSAVRIGVTGATTPTLTNNILGGWAIVNGTDFASYIPYSFSNSVGVGGFGALGTAGFAAYDGTSIPATSQPTQNIKVSAGNIALPSGGLNLNTLNWATTATTQAFTFANNNDILNLTAGGLLKSGGYANSIGSAVGNGSITAGGTASSGTQDLYIINSSSATGASVLTIDSTIVDTATALGSGTAEVELDLANINTTTFSGTISLVGANTYTGGTIIDGGTVTLDGAASTIVIPASGLTLNGATLTMDVNPGQIAAASTVTLNGLSTLNLVGSNTLDSLVFNDNGGSTPATATNPTVNIPAGGVLTLTDTTPITATSMTAATTPTIPSGGTLDFSGAANVSLVIDPIVINGQDVAPLTPTLNIGAVIQDDIGYSGTSLKVSGGGLLELGGANTFSGGVALTGDSGLDIAASSTGSPVASGPLGTGTLTIGDGSYFTSTAAANTVGNSYTVGGSFSVQGIVGLNLSGAGTFDSSAATITVAAPQATLTLSGALSGYTGMTLTKAGSGVLSLTSNNTFDSGSSIVLNAGTLIGAGAPATATPSPFGSAPVTINGGQLELLNNGTGSTTLISYANTFVVPSSNTVGASLTIGDQGSHTGNIVQVADLQMNGGQTLALTANNTYALRILEIENPSSSSPVTILASTATAITVYSYTGDKPVLSSDSISGSTLTFVANPATAYWGGAQDTNWNTVNGTSSVTTNWLSAATGGTDIQALPGSNTDVYLSANTVTGGNYSTTLGMDFTINSLTFTGTGTADASNPMSIGGPDTLTIEAAAGAYAAGTGITVQSGAAAPTISTNIVLGADQTWTNSSVNLFTIGGTPGNTITGSGTSLTIAGSGNTTISYPIQTGTGGLTMSGTGVLTLGGTNTYTGATNITAGTVLLAGSIAAGSTVGIGTAGALTGTGAVQGGATLTGNGIINLGGGGTIGGTLAVTGGNWNGLGSVAGAITASGSGNTFSIGPGATLTALSGLNVTGGALAGSGDVIGSVSYSSSSASVLSGVVADNGGTASSLVVDSSGGSLSLSGANTYTGGTTVISGTLYVDGSLSSSLAGSNVVTVQSGGTLAGMGSVPTSVTVQSGGTISAGHGGVGPLSVGSMVFGVNGGDTGTLNVSNLASDVTTANTAGYLSSTTLQANGGAATVTVNITGTAYLVNSDYIVATYTSALLPNGASDPFQLVGGSVTGLSSHESATLVNVAGTGSLSGGGNGVAVGTNALEVEITASPGPIWTGAATSSSFGPGAWIPPSAGTIGSPYNWSQSGNGYEFQDGDLVTFNDTASLTTVDISHGNVDPFNVTFNNNTTNYVIEGSNGIVDYAGSHTSVTLTGTGMVTINNANSFTGGVNLDNGVLKLGNAGAIGNNTNVVTFGPVSSAIAQLQLNGQSVTIAGLATSGAAAGTSIVANANSTTPATLTVAGTGTFAGSLQDDASGGSGSASLALEVSGSSTVLTLSGANTYSGGTTIDSTDTLQIGSGGSAGSIAGTINNSGTLTFDVAGPSAFSGTVTGGALIQEGAGTLAATGTLDPATIAIDGGSTLQIGDGITPGALSNTATITDNGTLSFAPPAGTTDTYSGSVGGNGGLMVNGAGGTLNLSGANYYSGDTTITAGTLQLVDGGSIPAGSTVTGTGTVPAGGISPGTLSFDYTAGSTFLNTISGNVNVANQTGTTILAGTNSFTGTLLVNAGTVQLGSASAVGGGNVTFAGGTLQYSAFSTGLDVSNQITNSPGAIVIDTNGQTVTFASAIGGSNTLGLTKIGLGTLILAGANSFTDGTGTTLVSAGTLQIGNNGASGVLPGNVTNNASLIFDRSDDTTFGGTISGSGTLTQVGAGTLTLGGTSASSSQAFVVANGTLATSAANAINTTGTLTLGASNGGTTAVNFSLGGNAVVGGLLVQTNTSTADVIALGANNLQVNGNVTLGSSATNADVTQITFTGTATGAGNGFVVGTTANPATSFLVSGANTALHSDAATVDMSGLSSFTANLSTSSGTFTVGDSTGATGGTVGSTLTLAANSSITTDILTLGGSTTEYVTETLNLGSGTNTIHAATVEVGIFGSSDANGVLDFATSTGTLTLTGTTGGASTANFYIVSSGTTGAAAAATGTVDLRGHLVDLQLGTLSIANRAGSSSTLNGTANFYMDTAGSTLSANTVTLSSQTGGSNGAIAGTFTIGGGTASFPNGIVMATESSTGTAIANTGVTGTLQINGGTVNMGGNLTQGANSSSHSLTATAIINLAGGTLNMGGKSLTQTSGSASAASTILQLNFTAGTLENLSQFSLNSGQAPVTFTGSGTGILAGTNSYTGGTLIDSGTLQMGGVNALPTAGAVTLGSGSSGGILDLNGFSQTAGTLASSGTATASDIVGNSSTSASASLTLTGSSTFAGIIQDTLGAGTETIALVFDGSGQTLTLTNANTYTGGTTVTAGTVQLGTGGSLATAGNLTVNGGNFDLGGNSQQVAGLSGSGGVIGNSSSTASTLTVTGAGTYSGMIADILGGGTATTALTFNGAGNTLTLVGASTYTGATTVMAGSLALNGGAGGSLGGTAVGVASGATFETIGNTSIGTSSAGTLTVNGTLSLQDGNISTLTFNNTAAATNLSFGPGATLDLDINSNLTGAAAVDLVSVGRQVADNATAPIVSLDNLPGSGLLVPGTYTLMSYATSSGLTNFTFLGGSTVEQIGGESYTLNTTSTALQLVVATNAAPNTAYWSGAIDGNWNTLSGTSTNWVDGPAGSDTNQIPGSTSDVYLTANSAANLSTTLGQDFTINSLTFTGTVTANSAGSSIAGSNTLTIEAAAGADAAGTGITVNSGSGPNTISANIALGGDQTWTNNSASLLTIGGTGGNTVSGSGYDLTIAGTGNTTISDPIQTGAGSLTMNGSGTLTLSGVNTYTGTTTVSGGTLALNTTGGVAISSGSANASINDLIVHGGIVLFQQSNQINPNANVDIQSGTFNLNGQSQTLFDLTNSGGTLEAGPGSHLTVTDPTWQAGINTVSPGATFTFDNLTISGGTNTIDGDQNGAGGGYGGLLNVQSGGLTFAGDASPNLTINSDTNTGTAGLLLLDSGVSFTGSAGMASITAGTGTSSTQPGIIDFDGNAATFNIASGTGTVLSSGAGKTDLEITASITDATGFGSAVAGTPNSLIKTGAGTLALLGSNTYSGGTTIDAGTIQINSNASLGAIGSLATINAGTLEAVANIDTTRNFALGSSSSTILVDSGLTYTIGGVISETSPNTGALNATGAGTLVLSDTNTYSLGTNITGGTVSVSSDTNLGSTLGGVTLSSGGTLAVTAGFSSDRNFTVGSGGGALNVTSGQTFTASGNGTWSGNSSGGTLTLSGGGTVQLNNGSGSYGSTGNPLSIGVAAGTLSGTASVIGNITINSGGTVSPATSLGAPATLTFEGSGAGTGTLNSGGNFAMNIADASDGSTLTSLGAGAGSNWNLLAVSSLADNLSSIAQFNVTVNGSLSNFNPAQAYQWDFITSAGGLNGVTANEFNLINGLPSEPGTFSIAVGNTLPGGAGYVALDYSPSAVPEPGSMALAGLAALGMTGLGWRQRRRRQLAAPQPDETTAS